MYTSELHEELTVLSQISLHFHDFTNETHFLFHHIKFKHSMWDRFL